MKKIAAQYISANDLTPQYQADLRRVAASMELAGLRPRTLDSSSVARWLNELPVGRQTKRNYLRMAKTLWAFAARHQQAVSIPDDLIRVKPFFRPPVAWTTDELQRLMKTAESLTGTFRGGECPMSLFWQAWVLLGYELGIRMGDLHNLRADQFRGNRVYITHHKTGVAQGKLITRRAQQLAESLIEKGDGETVFRWALARTNVYKRFRQVVKEAGLKGTTKFLRRSCATYCELAQPGSAPRALGHLSPTVARFYIDPTIAHAESPSPPPFLPTEQTDRVPC